MSYKATAVRRPSAIPAEDDWSIDRGERDGKLPVARDLYVALRLSPESRIFLQMSLFLSSTMSFGALYPHSLCYL